MTETNVPTHLAEKPQEEGETKSNFVQRFTNSHPRIARVAAITGLVTTAVGGVITVKTLRSNQDDLASAGDNFQEGVHDLASSVSPTDTES